jgi:quinoprotein glucose dehydrogenase
LLRHLIFIIALLSFLPLPRTRAAEKPPGIFDRDNLVAWCIVPFDAKKRSPAERVEMLARLGFKKYAYDWRAEHLPTFDAELALLKQRNIELTGVWFPDALNADARVILAALAKHGVKTQLWVTSGAADVDAAVRTIRPIADEAAKIGCTVALYNHGGWFGEPENQLAIIDKLRLHNVGIVYNLHHGHEHLDRFAQLLDRMRPHLLCLNLNGMTRGGDKHDQKILPLGQGEMDLSLLRIIRDSGYRGPIGILNHTDHDAEARLLDNLEGLQWLLPQLDGNPAGPAQKLRTFTPAAATKPSQAAAADYWAVEDAAARAKLPLYQTIPAATTQELTPANGWPTVTSDWSRSHGNDACTRFSPLDQINRDNVKSLKMAWMYRSGDGAGNIQCNPIIVDGVMYAPTPGDCIATVNAQSGNELWRFKPGGRPAMRGLTFYRGNEAVTPRLLFAAGTNLWAIDPAGGKPIASFGAGGKIGIVDCVAAPAVYQNVLVYAGWNRDVFGVDLATGKPLWTFHTVPQPGEEFAETWDKPQDGANCWGGMALDGSRGIVYVTLGSPKPNFVGVDHRGDNLFANCVVALNATSGKRLWHFQEIGHDIWDLDLPAPPMLVTVDRDGKKVDAVAAVTKIGNTLLLDRVSGKPLFPFRLRRAPASTLPGERTAAYQPDLELPQPFARTGFTLDDVTNISPKARQFVMSQLAAATHGWFEPVTPGKPLAMFGFHGGAEWTGASFDPTSGLLYVSANNIAWLPAVYRTATPRVDETTLPATAGRLIYAANCMACHGPSREGRLVNPPLIGISHRLKDADIVALLKTGRASMPPAPKMAEQQTRDLLDYLLDRDQAQTEPSTPQERPTYRDAGYPRLLDQENYPGNKPPWGTLSAINLNTGKLAWQVPLGEHEALTRRGITGTGTENFGGPVVTAGGLVFCAGTRDLKIRAFDKLTGEELWSHPLPFGGFAPPSVYQVDGKQYIVIAATGGGKLSVAPHPGPPQPMGDAYVAFALP